MITTNSSVFHGRTVLVGDSHVGKTSMLNMLVEKVFNPLEQGTVGANYQLFINDIEGTHVEMQIWDTAGQEKYKSLGPIYYRNSQAAICVYDRTSRESFNDLPGWIEAFVSVAGIESIIAIVANKADIEEVEVSDEEAREWAQKSGYLFYKTSAKTGQGIDDMFADLVKKVVQKGIAQHRAIKTPTKAKESSCC
ncbi:small GTP-binding protein, putative [Trichomonas vaginalis G3]|uniref:Small GTP-binding protein, putative n=1 Tax=Trichomonas vaginalis (strain ATCC PRA-98 / G3) TaxID=412133 RepID=A2F128_TRIV3|nr:GTPase protein [Trichomonas vaginalis G3]EAY01379.1 small GTP-binding protein, putative [Trichomonas vaginalis G3]KAI5497471.1 GTPase protein [Trichomonas vaginalis G3]|eukprot:XP_001330227.1 small GTP-binding protein [Trichomonas vaginalis G3]